MSSITIIANSFNASIVKNTVTSSKSVIIFRNVTFMLFQNIVIIIAHSKTVSSCITASIVISNIQLDSLNVEFTKSS